MPKILVSGGVLVLEMLASQLLCLEHLHYNDKLFRYAAPTEILQASIIWMQTPRERCSPNV